MHTVTWTLDAIDGLVRPRLARLAADDRGEGVISAAIAVLIMAFLGAAMWVAFNRMWETTATTTEEKVEQIGQ